MEPIAPKSPSGFSLKAVANRDLSAEAPPKDWPHAPVHRLSENGIYIVTAGTLQKRPLFQTAEQRDLLQNLILSQAKSHHWDLEAWAVFANHYHFVARGNPNSTHMAEFIRILHSLTARELNTRDDQPGRQVWHNFWDTRLTYQHAYLARLNYVHQNAVRHGLVPVANEYRWCSAAWFERVASPAQVKSIYGFKADRVKVQDHF